MVMVAMVMVTVMTMVLAPEIHIAPRTVSSHA
jgi:hypothetical protein